jgi:hypothetical protein
MSNQVKLSHLVALHQKATPVIEKAMLDVVWDNEDEALLRQVTDELNRLGADPDVDIDHDVPLGLGDTDALIRFGLSLFQLHEESGKLSLDSFENLLRPINEAVFDEVFDDIFNAEEE